MKTLILLCTLFSFSALAFDKQDNSIDSDLDSARQVNVTSQVTPNLNFKILPLSNKDIPSFNFKLFIKNKKKFEEFVVKNLGIIELSSAAEISHFLKVGSEKLIFESYLRDTPLLSEFIYRSLKAPEAVAKFTRMFIEFDKMILFSIIMIFSFIFSYLLAEYKFNYDVMSLPRIMFSFTRFGLINLFRFGAFAILFSQNYTPLLNVYNQSVLALSDQYPVLSTIVSIAG